MLVSDEIMEGFEHRFCLRHLYNNYKKFGGRTLIRNLIMEVAKTIYYRVGLTKILVPTVSMDKIHYKYWYFSTHLLIGRGWVSHYPYSWVFITC